jgi:RNA polymerase sigma-70 factor (ECF subfamily)
VIVTADEIRRDTARAATDPARFEAAFQEHWPRVYGVLFRLVGDAAEAEDLALEAFWRLYHRPPRESVNLAGWLYRVASNLGLNAIRSRRRRARYEEQAGHLALEAGNSPDPAGEAERAEERHQVRQALARMKPRNAQLLVLRHSGLSYTELAESLGVAPSSVGTLLARAEKEFERHFRQGEGG